jgi:hypothetical protein
MPQLAKTSMNVLRKSRGDADVLRLSSARPGLLISNTTAKSALGLDDTVHSKDLSQKSLKSIFEASKAGKPEGDFLTDCKYKSINYLGTGGIVPTKHKSKVPTGNRPGITNQDVVTKKYENFAVYSDFPKGPGGIEPNQLWQDGTYNEMMAQVTKEREALPEHITFLSPDVNVRTREFNLAGQVGGQLFGDALHKAEIQKYFDLEKNEYDLSILMNKGLSREQASKQLKNLKLEQDAVSLARHYKITPEGAKNILQPRGYTDAELMAMKIPDFDVMEYKRAYDRGENPKVNVIREGHPDELEDRRKALGQETVKRSTIGDISNLSQRLNLPHITKNPKKPITGSGAGDGATVVNPHIKYGGIEQLSMEDLARRPGTIAIRNKTAELRQSKDTNKNMITHPPPYFPYPRLRPFGRPGQSKDFSPDTIPNIKLFGRSIYLD